MTASVEYKDGTSPNFDIGVSITLAKEGGFVCHPKDPGGATNMGITIKTARLYRVDENGDGVTDVIDIKTLSRGTAKAIYYHGYWLCVKGDDLPPRLAFYAFDSAVNCGEGNGRRFLQQALGVKVDGAIGPKTLAAARACDTRVVLEAMVQARLDYYRRIIAANPDLATFRDGWMNRARDVQTLTLRNFPV